jgi:histidinol-phosphate/aromatic aminotransferase/cobyric acid decarboxylase-like protein
MRDLQSVREYVEEINLVKEQFYALFEEFKLDYQRSRANFIAFEHDKAADIVHYLSQRNILVRDGSRYSRGNGCVRMSVAGAQSALIVMKALREYLSQPSKSDADSKVEIPVATAGN